MAVTSGRGHVDALKEVTRRVLGEDSWPPPEPFNLDNGGDLLREIFNDVELHRRPGRIYVIEPELVVDYMRSMPQRDHALAVNRLHCCAYCDTDRGARRVRRRD